LERCAREGGCAVLTVELDKRAGEDTPRVSIKRVQPFEGSPTPRGCCSIVAIDDAAPSRCLPASIGDQRGGRGEVLVRRSVSRAARPNWCWAAISGIDERASRRRSPNIPGIRWASLKSTAAKLAEAA
jgi:DNA polymerase-3 subunit alpha